MINLFTNKQQLYTPIIYTINSDGHIIDTINLKNYPELLNNDELHNSSNFFGIGDEDYYHMNSINFDPVDGGIILSFRHLNQIIKINYKTHKIMWKLGGSNSDYKLTTEQKFSGQHFAYYTQANKLMLFDNGNLTSQTKVMEFDLDQQNKKILDFHSYLLGNFSKAMGNAIKLSNSNIIVGTGYHMKNGPDVIELDKTGKEVYTMEFKADVPYTSYRVYEYNDILK